VLGSVGKEEGPFTRRAKHVFACICVRLELYITAVAADKICVKLDNRKYEKYDLMVFLRPVWYYNAEGSEGCRNAR
jgi:hypothetical protein